MTRMSFGAENCEGVTSDLTGRHYASDRKGFIDVTDPSDVAFLKQGGFEVAGGMPRLRKFWVCACGWEASINSCPHCDRQDLTRVER